MRLGLLMACLGIVVGCQRPQDQHLNSTTAPSGRGPAKVFVDTSPHQHGFADLGAVTLHFLDWGGSGELLLLIPGLGNTAHTFDDFAPHFASRFRVVGVTLRGHGQSDRPPTGYDTATLVEDVRALADLLGAARLSLIGASIGSDVLTGFATAYPDRVDRLVYLDEASDPAELPALEQLEVVPPGLMLQPSRAELRSKYWSLIEGAGAWTPALEADMHFGQAVGPGGNVEPQLADPIAAQFIKGKAVPDHGRIKARVLAIFSHGYVWETVLPERRDQVRLVWNAERERHAERFRRAVPGAEVVVLEGAAHPLLIHRPAEVLRLTQEFLSK